MYLKRHAEDGLRESLASGRVTVVLGARQVGKTTLVEHVLSGARTRSLDFDVPADQAYFMAVAPMPPEDAMRALGAPEVLVLDEAQRHPEVARIVKGWYDAHVTTRFVLLGSSSLNLMDRTAEALTGRSSKLYLAPMLFDETIGTHEWAALDRETLRTHFAGALRGHLLQRLAFGSYPEAVTTSDPRRLLRELSSDYLWKDVLQAGQVRSPDTIRRLLLLLAHQVGAEVSTNELATQLQTARATVDRYLELLEQTFVVFRIPAFSTNPRKELVKSRKVFFWDVGIRNALLSAFQPSEDRPDIGQLWENWVIAEFAKRNALAGFPCELYFWRSRGQSEVDLVVRSEGGLAAYEIKWKRRRKPPSAFTAQYGVPVEVLDASDPFVADRLPL
jgi:predicted AAA+ superfamily ATPase